MAEGSQNFIISRVIQNYKCSIVIEFSISLPMDHPGWREITPVGFFLISEV
jgi:hypothetical protein